MKAKPRPRKMKLADMEECFVRLAAQLPDPKTELSRLWDTLLQWQ